MRALVLLALLAPALASAEARDVDQRELRLWTLEWQVPDEPVILGKTDGVDVVLRAFDHDGTPIDEAPPTLAVSTGELSEPERLEPGVFRARFTPPKERYPHLAVLGARIDRGGVVFLGFSALPLWGTGRLLVRTDPGASVELSIGARRFGPNKADRQGRVYVDILAPPGPEYAVARSIDRAGNRSEKVIGLGVPPFNRLALFPLQDVVVADGSGELEMIVFAVDKKGQPLFGADLEMKTTPKGEPTAPVALASGVYRLRYLPLATKKPKARVTVRLAKEKRSSKSIEVPFITGSAKAVALVATPDTVKGDGDVVVEVRARFTDKAGTPVTTRATTVTVEGGRIEGAEDAAEGERVVRWRVTRPSQKAPPTFIATDRAGNELGRLSLKVEAGAATGMTLAPLPPLPGDGGSAGDVAAAVVDVAGNPVPGEQIALTTTIGEIVGASTTKGGGTVARLVPPPTDRELRGVLTAKSGEFSATTSVRVLARDGPRLSVALGLRGGWAYNDIVAGGPDAQFRLRSPFLFDGAYLTMGIAHLSAIPVEVGGVINTHGALPFTLGLLWRTELVDDLALFVGGAGGVVMSDAGVENSVIPQRTIVPAVYGALEGALEYRLGPGALGAMLRLGVANNVALSPVRRPLGADLAVYYRIGL